MELWLTNPEHTSMWYEILKFKIFELIEERGQRVLHILPYHYHLNPTELVWSQMKRYYSSNSWQNMFGMEKGEVSIFIRKSQ
jgi:transposase